MYSKPCCNEYSQHVVCCVFISLHSEVLLQMLCERLTMHGNSLCKCTVIQNFTKAEIHINHIIGHRHWILKECNQQRSNYIKDITSFTTWRYSYSCAVGKCKHCCCVLNRSSCWNWLSFTLDRVWTNHFSKTMMKLAVKLNMETKSMINIRTVLKLLMWLHYEQVQKGLTILKQVCCHLLRHLAAKFWLVTGPNVMILGIADGEEWLQHKSLVLHAKRDNRLPYCRFAVTLIFLSLSWST